MMEIIQERAKAVYGEGARARAWRNTVRVETFELGEVLVVRHPEGAESAQRMAAAALLAQIERYAEPAEPPPVPCTCQRWESCEACFRQK